MAFLESNLNRFNSASNAMAQTEDAIQRRRQLNAERSANLNENIMEAGGNVANILAARKKQGADFEEAGRQRDWETSQNEYDWQQQMALERLRQKGQRDLAQFNFNSSQADRLSNLSDLFWNAFGSAAQAMGVWDATGGNVSGDFDWTNNVSVSSLKMKFMSLIANQSDEDKKALEAFFDSMVADRIAGREPEVPEKPSDRGGGRFGITLNTNLGLSSGRATGAASRGNTSGTTGRAAGYMNSIPETTSQSYSYGEAGVYVPTEQTQPAPVSEKKRGFWQRVSEAFR